MSNGGKENTTSYKKGGKNDQTTVFLTTVTFLVSYQIIISARNYAAAFDIKVCNMGIFISKLISFRSLLTAIGSLSQYLSQKYYDNETFRKYSSLVSLCLMFNCRLVFFIILYVTKNLALLSYIILNAEALFFGYFKMSLLSYFPEYTSNLMFFILILTIGIYLLQMVFEYFFLYKALSFIKTQYFLCVILTAMGIITWVYQTFYTDETFYISTYDIFTLEITPDFKFDFIKVKIQNFIDENPESNDIIKLKEIIDFLPTIRTIAHQICQARKYEGLKDKKTGILHNQKNPNEQINLEGILVKYWSLVTTMDNPDQTSTRVRRNLCDSILNDNKQFEKKIQSKEIKLNTDEFFANLMNVFSPFIMIVATSLIKDFLFPGILPYAVLNKERCRLVKMISPLFYLIGALTVLLVDRFDKGFKLWKPYCNCIWVCLIPQITILVITLSAIHTKVGFLYVVNSTLVVFFLCAVLLYFNSIMECSSYIGVANYVFWKSKNMHDSLGVLAVHNILGVFCTYLFSKISIGYNYTRLGMGPLFPNHYYNVSNGICFWITETIKGTFKDIFLDFKLNIRDYI